MATAVDELGKGLCVVAIAYQARSGRWWFMLGVCWSLGESRWRFAIHHHRACTCGLGCPKVVLLLVACSDGTRVIMFTWRGHRHSLDPGVTRS